jgi:cytochrome c biogenesis protein
VLQIIVAGMFAVIGMTIRQLPGFAFQSASSYADQMVQIHDRYDPLFGSAVVGVMERLQVFQVFSSTWFTLSLTLLLISIVACTLNRTPRLWHQTRDIRVVQPEPFFDPTLPDRAALTGVAEPDVRAVLRRHHFRLRAAESGGVRFLYGDRHQYTKMATLLTHLGLILFLIAAAVTSRFGFESPLVVATGETSTVQPIGTPGLLVVKNLGFTAPTSLRTSPSIATVWRSPARRSASMTLCPSPASPSTRTGSARRRSSTFATSRADSCGRAPWP